MATSATKLAQKLLKRAPTAKDYEKLYGTFAQYWKSQSPLAQEGIRMQLEKQFEPQITQGIGGIKQDFSNRGLLRSGIRGRSERQFLGDTASEFATQAEQLLAQREAQSAAYWNEQQRRYEKSPTTFKGTAAGQYKPYVVATPTAQQGIQDIYGGAGTYQTPEGYSYLQAYRDYLKRSTPDYYSKFYGNGMTQRSGGRALGTGENIYLK